MSYKKILNESTRIFDFVESIVRDIIKIFKTVDEGEFYLPEHFDPDKLVYTLSELSESLTVELIIEIDDEIDEFIVNSDYYRDDDVIVVLIKYNSKEKSNITFSIMNELREVIAHEIRHIHQSNNDMFRFKNKKEEDPYEYYTRPEELDAQVFGFDHLAKITNKSFEEVMKNWFKTHQEIHLMNNEEVQKVMKKLIDYKFYQGRYKKD
jgi:hypothetical protein